MGLKVNFQLPLSLIYSKVNDFSKRLLQDKPFNDFVTATDVNQFDG